MTESEFPHRPMMEPAYEDSMMKRYLAKEPRESVLLADMETDAGWRLTGNGEMSYTHERSLTGTRSMRVRIPMRNEDYLSQHSKDGSLKCKQGGNVAVILDFDPPRDWTDYNRISLWVYVHPAEMHSYACNIDFSCEGSTAGPTTPLPVHFVQDMEPGKWNHIVWEIPDLQRDRVTRFAFAQLLRGHCPEEGGTMVYDIDRVELQKVEPTKYRGWSVYRGSIAFHHVGYRPSGPKVAFAGDTGAEEFELVEAETGEPAARFPVKRISNPRGEFEVLDFGDFTEPGRYFLRCGEAASRPFDISEEVLYGTIKKTLNFYYGMRCGFAVPGVHGKCHLDLRGRHGGEMKTIDGGWHDAGDLSQGSHRTGASLYGMLRNYRELCRREVQPELRERLLEEIRWGLDWLLKTRFGDGYRVTWATARIYTDNEIGTLDDTIVKARHTPYENFLSVSVFALAHRALRDADPERAEKCLRAAVDDFRATIDARENWSELSRNEAGFGALAAVQLYRATGEEQYAEQAARFGRGLVECQRQSFADDVPMTGYFYRSNARQRVVHDHHLSFEGAPVVALEALCEAFPEHEDWMEWYGAALLHSQYFLAPGAAASAPYEILANSVWSRDELEEMAEDWREKDKDPEPLLQQYEDATPLAEGYRLRVFPLWVNHRQHGSTGVRLAHNVALSAAARLRNDPELQRLAERQFQWILGGNPFSQSLMYGEGYDFQPHFAYCFRDMVGALPVGMDSMANDEPWWTCFNDSDYKEIWVVPVSRFLWSAAYAATPARVEGAAGAEATFTHLKTGAEVSVSGEFEVNLPPGAYRVECGPMSRRMQLLAGSSYHLALDAEDWVDVDLGTESSGDTEVTLRATVRGAGEHEAELRVFNGSVDRPKARVDLGDGGERTLEWVLRVESPDRPWAAVLVPDGDAGTRREAFGTLKDLRPVGE